MKNISMLIAFIYSMVSYSQVGIGTTSPNQESVLELSTTNKGLLMSVVELQSTISPNPLSAHTAGMTVYNTATAGTSPNNVYPGLYYNDGSVWQRLEGFSPDVGKIKNSVETADHNGWYLLNGRALSSLPAVAQTSAADLGFVTNLPNSADRYLKGNNGAESFAQSGGAVSYVLTGSNLPNINYTGVTGAAGSHQHSFTSYGNTYWHGPVGTAVSGLTTVGGDTRTTGSAGDHTHSITVPTGGSNTPVNFVPRHLVVQTFIYLGK